MQTHTHTANTTLPDSSRISMRGRRNACELTDSTAIRLASASRFVLKTLSMFSSRRNRKLVSCSTASTSLHSGGLEQGVHFLPAAYRDNELVCTFHMWRLIRDPTDEVNAELPAGRGKMTALMTRLTPT